jgi:hypothetical protein
MAVELGRSQRGREGNLKRNKRDGNWLHMFVVHLMMVPAGLEIREWIRTPGLPDLFIAALVQRPRPLSLEILRQTHSGLLPIWRHQDGAGSSCPTHRIRAFACVEEYDMNGSRKLDLSPLRNEIS